jgi:hypothetical protein
MTADDPTKKTYNSSADATLPDAPTVANPAIDDSSLDASPADDLSILDAWDTPQPEKEPESKASDAPAEAAKPTATPAQPGLSTAASAPSVDEKRVPFSEPSVNSGDTMMTTPADATIPRASLARAQARALGQDNNILPSRGPKLIDSQAMPTIPPTAAMTRAGEDPPWTLQQFFNGEIDLDLELTKRFPKMPMMSRIKFRQVGTSGNLHSAMLATQDGRANLTIDADPTTRRMQMSFTIESMITLRFMLANLSDMDRDRWLELMRREQGGLAFLWGPDRWQSDYIICLGRKYFTNLYAFSPNNFEAGIRMTPNVSKELLDWLQRTWKLEQNDEEPPPLLTW